jgi:hypothetical protein
MMASSPTPWRLTDITRLDLATTAAVADAPVLQWIVLLGALAGGAYAGMQGNGCESGGKRAWCGIGGALLGGYIVGEIASHVWPTHMEERWKREW